MPPLPKIVDPDAWLLLVDGKRFSRKVRANRTVLLDHTPYAVSTHLAGQYIDLCVSTSNRHIQVFQFATLIKTIPLKHLVGSPMTLDAFLEMMRAQALAEARKVELQRQQKLLSSFRHF